MSKNTESATPWSMKQEADAAPVLAGRKANMKEDDLAGPSISRTRLSVEDFANVRRDVDEERDNLFVPPDLIPENIAVEWKRMSVFNKEDKGHQAQLRRAGWRPVPANSEGFSDHFASYISPGSDIIEYEGAILMYRPKTMSVAAANEQRKLANRMVQDKMDEMGMTVNRDIPGKKFQLNRGYGDALAGGNPNAITAPE